jgi:hypothetical protein
MSGQKEEFVVVRIVYNDGSQTGQVVELEPTSAQDVRRRVAEVDGNFDVGCLAPASNPRLSLAGAVHVPPGQYVFVLSVSGGNAYISSLEQRQTLHEQRQIAALRNQNELNNAKRVTKANQKYFSEPESAKPDAKAVANLKLGSKLEESGSESSLPVLEDTRHPFRSLTSSTTDTLGSDGKASSDGDSVNTDAAVTAPDEDNGGPPSRALRNNQDEVHSRYSSSASTRCENQDSAQSKSDDDDQVGEKGPESEH